MNHDSKIYIVNHKLNEIKNKLSIESFFLILFLINLVSFDALLIHFLVRNMVKTLG